MQSWNYDWQKMNPIILTTVYTILIVILKEKKMTNSRVPASQMWIFKIKCVLVLDFKHNKTFKGPKYDIQ